MSARVRRNPSRERGQVVVLFALLLPAFLALSGFVVGIGNWYTHAKHLQTKADAGAFAGGGVWGFPCGPDIDLKIEQETREYAGPHIKADGTPYAGATYNPQIGNVSGSQVHVVLNGTAWYDDDSNPSPLAELNSPANASICNAKVVDVKMTEDNSFPLASLIPLFPDIKRKARVEIQEIEGLSGLLPIAVRVPRPLSAVAVFYDEGTGLVLDAKNMCEKIGVAPVGLSGWTTLDPTNQQGPGNSSICTSWADFNVPNRAGVVVATSFRPNCDAAGATAPCLQDSGWVGSPVTNLCRQASGAVQCWDATGAGSTQNVQAGVQFIRGYDATGNGNGPPRINSVFFDAAPASCGGAYFNSIQGTCSGTQLTVKINLGTLNGTYPNPSPPPANVVGPLQANDVEVTYMLGRSDGSDQCSGYPASCQLNAANANATGVVTFTTTGANHPQFTADSQANAIGIQVRVRNTTNLSTGNCAAFQNACRFYYIGSGATPVNQNSADQAAELVASPIQRSFSGSLDRTGSLKWTRLTADVPETGPQNCDGLPAFGLTETGEAASSRTGRNCFYFEMGLQGGLALDQDEPPLAFNLGTTGSQRALIDCDDAAGSNLASEIQFGCTPRYATHQFTYSPYCPPVNSINALLGTHPSPWDAANGWPPAGGTRCVITQTGASNQIMPGFNQRLFGVNNNPVCPNETGHFVKGRNYWHDANNDYSDALGTDLFTFAQNSPGPRGNRLKNTDPRLVTLFFTPYESFAASGNSVFPIVGFGAFYVTGYGRTTGGGGSWQGGGPEDPCTEGNVGNPLDGLPYGVGNEPPPDLNLGANQTWVWGHFVNPVLLTSNANPSGVLCQPGVSFQPCVAVLVE